MTELTAFQKKITEFLPEISLRMNEPMSRHTSFRIGGPVEVMAFPKNKEELASVLKASALLDCKTAILGAGTNVLAPDAGISGLVICLKDCLDGMEQLDDTHIRVMAGVTMTRAAVFAANLGLAGMEFAHGIPGTVGGGVYMNAGAYGGEICQVCQLVEVVDMHGLTSVLTTEEMGFSYRHSLLEEQGIDILYTPDIRILDSEEMDMSVKIELAKFLFSTLNMSYESVLSRLGMDKDDEFAKRLAENEEGFDEVFSPRASQFNTSNPTSGDDKKTGRPTGKDANTKGKQDYDKSYNKDNR